MEVKVSTTQFAQIILKTNATKIRFLFAWEDNWFLPSLTWNAPGKLLCFIHHTATPSKAPKVHEAQTCFVSQAVPQET